MEYIAHKAEKDGEISLQSLKEHLENTAELAEKFSLPAFKPVAKEAARLHDIGKYSEKFQKKINSNPGIRVQHAICGAKECEKLRENNKNNPIKTIGAILMEYCIAGHHAGLPDGGNSADIKNAPTLAGQLKGDIEDYSAYKREITPEEPDFEAIGSYLRSAKSREEIVELFAFFTKYVFSCLTDADFIDTERFFSPDAERTINGDIDKAIKHINERLEGFTPDSAVKAARARLLEQAVQNSLKSPADIYLLNMPTGSGKTLCSLKIALEKANITGSGKQRIIYVIPYTSIIEQTAEVFSGLLKEDMPVLQHHSNFDIDSESEQQTTADKLRRACENWDAPLVVTTSVQFFQSLYHYKGSRLRKLHNMANSVIVFDEIHLIPIEYLQPCLRAVGYITKYLNSTAIFLSATMPDYTQLFKKYIPDCRVCELITDKSDFTAFKSCQYINLGEKSFEEIAARACESESSLIIVNSRRSARRLYGMLSGRKFHLSTYMTPRHRSEVIKEIKECLSNRERIAVVSTSLVEAGVDFDFQTVFRELAGLDNILQSGGRCNREGLRANSAVYIFKSGEKIKGDIEIRANVTENILSGYDDITTPGCVEDYYSRLFGYNQRLISKNSISTFEGAADIMSVRFRSYAASFQYINDADTISIVINNCDECEALIERLAAGAMSARRRLQNYSVSVYRYEFDDIIKRGLISEINGVYILSNNDYYDENSGLCPDANIEYIV